MYRQLVRTPVVAVYKLDGRRHSCCCGCDLFRHNGSLRYGECGPFIIDCMRCGNQYDSNYVLEVVRSA